MVVKIQVLDAVSPAVAAAWEKLGAGQRKSLMAVVGRSGEQFLRRWFADLDSSAPNTHGWTRQHFWARIRRATAYVPSATTDSSALVTVADPALRLKVNGGVVTPRQAKALAIPLNNEAYVAGSPGAKRIPGLSLIPAKDQGKTVGYLGKMESGSLVLYYRLARSVTHRADPSALPARTLIVDHVRKAADSFIKRRTV